MFDESGRLMPVDNERNIAIAAIHVGGLSVDVLSELRDRQIELPIAPKGHHGARPRGVQLLHEMQKWSRFGRGAFGSMRRRRRETGYRRKAGTA